jgi:hypothetical protein
MTFVFSESLTKTHLTPLTRGLLASAGRPGQDLARTRFSGEPGHRCQVLTGASALTSGGCGMLCMSVHSAYPCRPLVGPLGPSSSPLDARRTPPRRVSLPERVQPYLSNPNLEFWRWEENTPAVNGPAIETQLVETAENLEDDFRQFALAFAARLRAAVTELDDYRQQRSIIRTLDRRGVDSVLARRELQARRKEAGTGDNEAA